MSEDVSNPFGCVVGSWDAVIEDMEAIATEYRDAGWDVLELHPGDVVVLEEPDRFGVEALVPDDEFDRLSAWVDMDTQFNSYEVYRMAESGVVFVLACLTGEADERAVCVPAYYELSNAGGLRERAEREGVFPIHVRRLRRDRAITFTQDDPDLFFPE